MRYNTCVVLFLLVTQILSHVIDVQELYYKIVDYGKTYLQPVTFIIVPLNFINCTVWNYLNALNDQPKNKIVIRFNLSLQIRDNSQGSLGYEKIFYICLYKCVFPMSPMSNIRVNCPNYNYHSSIEETLGIMRIRLSFECISLNFLTFFVATGRNINSNILDRNEGS